MMLAHRVERDVAHEHHLLVMLVERLAEMLGGILLHAREHLLVHARHARGRLDEPVAVGILPDPLQDHPHALFDLLKIHLHSFHG